ncbi:MULTISPECIES: hypothetical protein [unclassified Endozoicomonas]|uniref:hypothetical protein n=1 Tax=unclassified Endozoicomonas TaxID=2644528 RepID=UPI003BB73FBD
MTTRRQIKINNDPQLDIFSTAARNSDQSSFKESCNSDDQAQTRRFIAPDVNSITLGNTSLKEHLELTDQKAPFTVASLLDEQD